MPLIRPSPFTALLSVCLVTALLYLGKPFLLPLTLAILVAFLLGPVVARLEAWGLKRVPAVIIVAIVSFGLCAGSIYVVATQLVDLVDQWPSYRENVRANVLIPLEHLSSTFSTLTRDLQPKSEPTRIGGPMPVEVVTGRPSMFGIARGVVGPILSPLGTAAIVIVTVIFFLIDRQNLRDRFIHLVGRGRLHVTTQAIDDAAHRVSRYLGAQLIVNATYGIPVGIGLFIIGIPNAALWGLLAIVLRFIPYLGAWIAALFPVALSVAISPSWVPPVATISLFITMELLSNNVVEPWLYGSSTGLSPSAIVVSAAFWTWLWGPGGLLLATPLTVCLAVMGKYVPSLSFLDILLGDRPPIAPEHRFYQRLLAGDYTELDEMISTYADRGAYVELFDEVVMPALHLAEQDVLSGNLEADERREMCRHLREALGGIDGFALAEETATHGVAIVPARTECDALAGSMLAFLLRSRGFACTCFSERALASEVQVRLAERADALVCASALTPLSVRAAGNVFKRLGSVSTGAKLLGFWAGDRSAGVERLNQPGVEVVATFADALRFITSSTAEPIQPVATVAVVVAEK